MFYLIGGYNPPNLMCKIVHHRFKQIRKNRYMQIKKKKIM